MADDGITGAVEDSYFVVMGKNAFPAFVVEHDDVIGFVLFVVDNHLRTPFAEGLDDFGSLRTSAAAHVAGVDITAAAAVAGHLPGLAVSDKNSRPLRVRSGCLCGCGNQQQR